MKFIISPLIAIIASLSCNSKVPESEIGIDTKAQIKNKLVPQKDTTIEYSIDGLSSEGIRAIAKYFQGKIKECTISIYGETGQNRIYYTFDEGKINVVEKHFIYKAGIESVKTENGLKLNKQFSYVLDINGTVVGKAESDRSDIFFELKKVVPFKIKYERI